ncbi:hypothetical protein ACPCG0_14415 [Propionibacteriaceae bacterium Y1923]|uniref:hypothetical protein n=1 Tax=Aestuariimicrobium sp. Y1814 TaxID=3418742 RepID=UPI003C222A21
MGPLWEFIRLVFTTAGDVMTLRAPAEVIGATDQRWQVAVAIAVVAALSGLLGNAGFLAINRVRGLWVVAAWALASLQSLVALAFQGLVLWLAAWVALSDVPDVGSVVRVVLLSTAPLWFAVLAITPYLGPLVLRVLWAWQLLTLWGLMNYLLPDHYSDWGVLGVVVVAWLAATLVKMLLNPVVQWVRRALWRGVMRRPLRTSTRELLEASTPLPLVRQHAPPTRDSDEVHSMLGAHHRGNQPSPDPAPGPLEGGGE